MLFTPAVAVLLATQGRDQLPMPTMGAPAPELAQMAVVQGKGLGKYEAGQVYVIEFWATWCSPCVHAIAQSGEIIWPNCDMKTLCTLFQNFMYGKTIIDETGDTGRYDVHLKWVPGDQQSVTEMMTGLGLTATKTHRMVRTLVVRQKPTTK